MGIFLSILNINLSRNSLTGSKQLSWEINITLTYTVHYAKVGSQWGRSKSPVNANFAAGKAPILDLQAQGDRVAQQRFGGVLQSMFGELVCKELRSKTRPLERPLQRPLQRPQSSHRPRPINTPNLPVPHTQLRNGKTVKRSSLPRLTLELNLLNVGRG